MLKDKSIPVWVFVIAAVVLVIVSVASTLIIAKQYRAGFDEAASTKRALGIVENRPKFDTFAGHGVCEAAIYANMEGKIVTLQMDERAAIYNDFERTNTLLFTADVVPADERFLSEHRSTIPMQAQCVTSADNNKLVTLVIAPADQ
ncbi:hypothetical protein [Simiduia agarivorans]|uniref:Uncharacterized protein n=1 Tax=Simiduia agarivorans (strain DSM 21679 / JCM 13881 / BCRC 17597 / SA1) TaxID=1117647 RepID=K4KK23_SIMAS|nr:hypothetical protein [Simiduia agarivorans]AFU98378.1 hypothetical protein M5M_05905 [Simiduia agarivorans SA1 = DSM 21679]